MTGGMKVIVSVCTRPVRDDGKSSARGCVGSLIIAGRYDYQRLRGR